MKKNNVLILGGFIFIFFKLIIIRKKIITTLMTTDTFENLCSISKSMGNSIIEIKSVKLAGIQIIILDFKFRNTKKPIKKIKLNINNSLII
jgi:hypothetical protein